MPTDASGNYSLPAGYLAVTGDPIVASQHNPPLEDIAEALTRRMSVNGATPMTGQFKATDGTVSAPGIGFNTAQNTGFFKTADGIGVAIGGVEVVEFTSSGLASGARFLGELIPYTGSTALPLTVFPVGQTLLRSAYPDLWTFAQTEIAAGSTFYNNGNGSTTFGIGDCRGRFFANKDDMGGSAASRLTTAGGGVDGATLGAAGGAPNGTILQANLPAVNFTVTGNVAITANGVGALGVVAGSVQSGTNTGSTFNSYNTATFGSLLAAFSGGLAASGGSGTAFKTVPPVIITNCLLFAGA